MKKPILFALFIVCSFLFTQCTSDDNTTEPLEPLVDIDGNVYQTIKMGDQIWMLENLKVTKLNDGTPLDQWVFGDDWFSFSGPITYYQWADTSDLGNMFDEELPFDYYGAMYNETTLTSGKLAPTGWRIPTEQDFKILETFLSNDGHRGNEATVLKSTSGWGSTAGNGTDVYGFNTLPNGYVAAGGTATGAPVICTWATSDVNRDNQTRKVVNLFDESTILYASNSIRLGAGVRLIKE
jgi:uncharacterized protein (TIGR02145 family)